MHLVQNFVTYFSSTCLETSISTSPPVQPDTQSLHAVCCHFLFLNPLSHGNSQRKPLNSKKLKKLLIYLPLFFFFFLHKSPQSLNKERVRNPTHMSLETRTLTVYCNVVHLEEKMRKGRVNWVYNCFQRAIIQSLKMLVEEENGKWTWSQQTND